MTKPNILKLNIDDLQDLDNIEAVFESKIRKVGNGAMAGVYRKYLGLKAIVIVLMKDSRQKNYTKKLIKQLDKDYKEGVKKYNQF